MLGIIYSNKDDQFFDSNLSFRYFKLAADQGDEKSLFKGLMTMMDSFVAPMNRIGDLFQDFKNACNNFTEFMNTHFSSASDDYFQKYITYFLSNVDYLNY